MSGADCCAVDPRAQQYKPEIRTFVTYLPKWMPRKPRKWFLQKPSLYPNAGGAARLMLGLQRLTGLLDSIDRRRTAYLLVAYARDGGKYAFEFSNRVWQEECARHLCGGIAAVLPKVLNMFGAGDSPVNMTLIGMQPSTRRLQFRWMAVQVTLDIHALFEALIRQRKSAAFFYERRWGDSRYGCITQAKCPVPATLAKFKQATDIELGVAFDWLVNKSVSSYVIHSAYPAGIGDIVYKDDVDGATMPKTLLLSAPLRQLWNTNDQRLVDLERRAREMISAQYLYSCSGDADFLLRTGFTLPATIIAEIDQLVEEIVNETLDQGQ